MIDLASIVPLSSRVPSTVIRLPGFEVVRAYLRDRPQRRILTQSHGDHTVGGLDLQFGPFHRGERPMTPPPNPPASPETHRPHHRQSGSSCSSSSGCTRASACSCRAQCFHQYQQRLQRTTGYRSCRASSTGGARPCSTSLGCSGSCLTRSCSTLPKLAPHLLSQPLRSWLPWPDWACCWNWAKAAAAPSGIAGPSAAASSSAWLLPTTVPRKRHRPPHRRTRGSAPQAPERLRVALPAWLPLTSLVVQLLLLSQLLVPQRFDWCRFDARTAG